MPLNEGQPAAPKLKNAPVVLAILDGWGQGPKGPGNAVALAHTPFFDRARRHFPFTALQAHGRYVGLMPYQEGNSEAGHMNIGAGRVVRQDIVNVTEAIKDGTFFKNTAFKEALKHAKKYGTKVHLMGMLANSNSAHASPDHLYALLKLCRDEAMSQVRLHLFTDGRDSPPFSATRLLHELEHNLSPGQEIASVMGRFYAMDRNKLWHRTELAYHAIVAGEGLVAPNAHTAILRGYNRGESDEFILPTVMIDAEKRPIGTVDDNDVVIFFNLRSDRARQLTKCFVQRDFEKRNENSFRRRKVPRNMRFAAMSEFGPDLEHVYTAFPSATIEHGLTETLAPFRQFYIAESEKYAHVTYFFNGGFDHARFGEERMRVPSQFVPHHDSMPEMRARVIADEAARRLRTGTNDLIVINFANADMVGHTGNLKATVKAIEVVDECLAKLSEAANAAGGCLVIVGDHGNAEKKINEETGEIMTEHTDNPVPFIIACEKLRKAKLGDGMLADVAPTVLDILDVPKPAEMTGFSLLRK
ncbi:MAG TPA: 2,3-bisphosphoglycerate-independent phosphoglycerate mutase [Candidatus Binatia bacterium]|nr:2,3-bisphosphoglycerate-independent phosphoglycerate mutase [Candidatus Binatia bacterium]